MNSTNEFYRSLFHEQRMMVLQVKRFCGSRLISILDTDIALDAALENYGRLYSPENAACTHCVAENPCLWERGAEPECAFFCPNASLPGVFVKALRTSLSRKQTTRPVKVIRLNYRVVLTFPRSPVQIFWYSPVYFLTITKVSQKVSGSIPSHR